MTAANYLKGYPYLFVRETDQTNYFCTICEGYLKEEQLQSHLFDEHRAEDCHGYFYRVCVEQTNKGYFTQKKYIFVCVVCWGKFPSSTDMSTHRLTCKLTPSPTSTTTAASSSQHQPSEVGNGNNRRRTPVRRNSSSSTLVNSNNRSFVEDTEPTKVISTPDISFISGGDNINDDGYKGNNGVSPPRDSSPPEIIVDHSQPGSKMEYQGVPIKRGRKKQLHPQQVLPPYRIEERYRSASETPTSNGGHDEVSLPLQQQHPQQNFLQCSLCNEIMPSSTYAKHLREYHRVGTPLENTLCPMCNNVFSLSELTSHLAASHGVVTSSAVSTLLLWVMTNNNFAANLEKAAKESIKSTVGNKMAASPINGGGGLLPDDAAKTTTMPPMMPPFFGLPNMFPGVFPPLSGKLPLPVGKMFSPPMSVTSPQLSNLSNISNAAALAAANAAGTSSAQIPSFLQALLNGESPSVQTGGQPQPQLQLPPPMPSRTASSAEDRARGFAAPTSPVPSKMAVEGVISKLTRRHVGPNNKESFQCLICAKWFAVPPVKHMRGHLVNFRDENRRFTTLTAIGPNCHICLMCFNTSDTVAGIEVHMSTFHPLSSPQHQQHHQQRNGGNLTNEDDLPLGATFETTNKTNNSNSQYQSPSANNSNLPSETILQQVVMSDSKGVELDNAGRVKSGKVRKQCELCGQWSNIKWFFKHMSEVHQALFCRCCREYLPTHEQEEHRRWHAEPPYMGQKIRIENGQPIIIDRKERASLTPIGSLAAWGGSSGGMVVKAVDDAIVPSTRKRKVAAGNVSSAGTSDGELTITPAKMSATGSVFGEHDPNLLSRNGKETLMPKETCPVCGILITYKNLARHIKLRHKIKYKFCHKCRKFVPNDTYEEHKVTCIQVGSSPAQRSDNNESLMSDQFSGADCSDGHREQNDEDFAQVRQFTGNRQEFANTPPSSIGSDADPSSGAGSGDRKSIDASRANTSKTKLESLLGKEFKHPRRRCAICGYTVSYSNFKRHLRNAHPNEYSQCEKDTAGDFGSAFDNLSHAVVDDDQPSATGGSIGGGSGSSVAGWKDDDEEGGSVVGTFVECRICGDQILSDFLPRHLKMNHPQEAMAIVEPKEPELVEEDDDESDEGEAVKDEEDAVTHVTSNDVTKDDYPVDPESPILTAAGKPLRLRECPECKVEMRAESVVKHCKLKHKMSYKFCNNCNVYVTKKEFRTHVRKHVGGERPNTRFGGHAHHGDDAKSSQEEEETEEEETAGQNKNNNNKNTSDDVDVDEDEDRLTIDFKSANSDDNVSKADQSNNELSINNVRAKD